VVPNHPILVRKSMLSLLNHNEKAGVEAEILLRNTGGIAYGKRIRD